MATTIISSNMIAAGIPFSFLAAGDALVVLPGVTLASTGSDAIGGTVFSRMAVRRSATVTQASSRSLVR